MRTPAGGFEPRAQFIWELPRYLSKIKGASGDLVLGLSTASAIFGVVGRFKHICDLCIAALAAVASTRLTELSAKEKGRPGFPSLPHLYSLMRSNATCPKCWYREN